MADQRNSLRTTFDTAVWLYDEVRPGYPENLFDGVVTLSGIQPAGRILEIGFGTGQATVPFARRGYHILCIELGENLAAVAHRNLEQYPQSEVRTGAFEEWPLQKGAFHWLDPDVAYPRVARSLRDGGSLALFWNVHVHSDASEGFFDAAQRIYEREAPEIVGPDDYKGLPRPDEVHDRTDEIQNTGLFGRIATHYYRWDETYDAESYLLVLSTYSGHRSLSDDTRRRLFHGIADLIDDRFGGRIDKGYLTTLYVARKE